MRQVGIRALEPGMVIARDVRNFHGQVLLRAGTVIDVRFVAVLKAWGVETVDIESVADREAVSAPRESSMVSAAALVREKLRRSDLGHPLVAEIARIASARLAAKSGRPD